MSNIRLPSDYGGAVVINGIPYERVSPTVQAQTPDTAVLAGHVTGIESYNWFHNDAGAATGTTYSAAKVAVAEHVYGTSIPTTTSSFDIVYAAAPKTGVLRLYGASGASVWIDGAQDPARQLSGHSGMDGARYSARVWRVLEGEEVKIGYGSTGKTVVAVLWPDEGYPPPAESSSSSAS